MNVFVLDREPSACAEYHCDRHVSRSILDIAKILSIAHVSLDGVTTVSGHAPLALTLFNQSWIDNRCVSRHPWVLWASRATVNYDWLHSLLGELLKQYTARFANVHGFTSMYVDLSSRPLLLPMKFDCIFDWPQCMPTIYHRRDTIRAYRAYYVNEKRDLAQWSEPAAKPAWWDELSRTECINEHKHA